MRKLTIEEMHKLAASHGGRCLSDEYLGFQTKLEWQCAIGHTWYAIPSDIKRGRWCLECAGKIRRRKWSISDLQDYAGSLDGKILSKKYSGLAAKYRWECADGHVWSASADPILRGSWCPRCANRLNEGFCRAYFESIFNQLFPTRRPKWLINERGNRMELDGYCQPLKLAFEYNGKQHYKRLPFFQKSRGVFERLQRSDKTKRELCLVNGVTLIVVPYTVPTEQLGDYIAERCSEKGFTVPPHWSSKGVDLSSAYSPKKLQNLRDVAESRGGRCLSEHYLGMLTKHKWECEHEHRWKAIPDSVINGTWCPKCASRAPPTNEEIQALAKSRGGICLSESYKGYKELLSWRCEKGHEWNATYSTVQQGAWCHECGGSKPKTLNDMHQLATNNGGLCLSDKYVNSHTKLLWQCANGHRWRAIPTNIQSGKWCPECRDTILSLEYMQQLAAEHDGLCLSKSYKNNRTHLEWECAAGHRWKAQPRHIVDGIWCRVCAGLKRRLSIEDMRALADRKGGKCLSAEYVKSNVHLEWECENGHRWMAKPNNIQQGKWCRECYNERRGKQSK